MAVARRRLVQRAAANVASVPSPVGGWNARDSLANMAPTDAVQLENYFPGVSNVVLRGGYVKHATGFPDDVETLMTYSGGTAADLKLDVKVEAEGKLDASGTEVVGGQIVRSPRARAEV